MGSSRTDFCSLDKEQLRASSDPKFSHFGYFWLTTGKLWTAPELLERGINEDDLPEAAPEVYQRADVYSFAIIVHEIVLREGPFYLDDCDGPRNPQGDKNWTGVLNSPSLSLSLSRSLSLPSLSPLSLFLSPSPISLSTLSLSFSLSLTRKSSPHTYTLSHSISLFFFPSLLSHYSISLFFSLCLSLYPILALDFIFVSISLSTLSSSASLSLSTSLSVFIFIFFSLSILSLYVSLPVFRTCCACQSKSKQSSNDELKFKCITKSTKRIC